MTGKIFISYRRDDEPGYAGRLFDSLQKEFGANQLFLDVDGIQPGQNFPEIVADQIEQSDVLLAVIGKRWLDATDKAGARRIDKSDDFVHIEIKTALEKRKQVIPVLIGDTRMPSAEDLPNRLMPLATRNAVRLTNELFKSDSARLIAALKSILKQAAVENRRTRLVAARKRSIAFLRPTTSMLLLVILFFVFGRFVGYPERFVRLLPQAVENLFGNKEAEFSAFAAIPRFEKSVGLMFVHHLNNNLIDVTIQKATFFVINEDGYALAPASIFANEGSSPSITLGFGKDATNWPRRNAILVKVDKEHGVALIKMFDTSHVGPTPISHDEIKVSDTVFMMGFPAAGSSVDWRSGKVLTVNGNGGSDGTVALSIPIVEGMQGSPIFNKNGEVIAIAVSSLQNGLGTGAQQIQSIAQLLESIGQANAR